MKRVATVMVVMLAVAASYGLFRVKLEVRDLEIRSQHLAGQIDRDGAAIDVLTIEVGYLTRPERLQALNDKFLDLGPLSARQILTLDDLPRRREDRLAGANTTPRSKK